MFVEIMIAIFLLAIFGTSLFVTQAKIFAVCAKTHAKVAYIAQSDALRTDFAVQLARAARDKKSFDTIAIDKTVSYPPSTVHLSLQPFASDTEVYQKFEKQMRCVMVTSSIGDIQYSKGSFLWTPDLKKEVEA